MKYPKPFSFVFYVLVFNIAWDFLTFFYENLAVLPIFRGVIIGSFSLYGMAISPSNRLKTGVLLFVFYIVCLFPFSDNPSYSIATSIKVFLSLLMLPLGFFLIRSLSAFKLLANNVFWLAALILIGFLAFNVFGVGGGTYTDEIGFDVGTQSDNWNVLSYVLLVSPLYFLADTSKLRRRLMYFFILAISIILLISFKRIAISGVAFGFMVFLLFYRNLGRFLKVSIVAFTALIVLSPLYLETLNTVYKAREDRFQEGALKKEGRYLESIEVWEETFSFEDPLKSIFGGQAFYSMGNYADGGFGRRQLHVDYNLILNTNGIVGLLLYVNIYWQMFRQLRQSSKVSFKERKMLVAVFWTLFYTTLYTSIAGQMYAITFRSIAFLFMGAILGTISRPSHKNNVKIIEANAL